MKSLIIYAHPWDGSFNKHILDKVKFLLTERGKSVDVIDLVKDEFNPVLTANDLRLFGKGEYFDPLAKNYVERLKLCDEVVIIHPIWWYGEPAILKGFYEKVFLKNHAYAEVDKKLQGLLGINKAAILTTANIDREIFKAIGNPVENVTINGILKSVGINNVTWIHCPTVHLEDSRNYYLKEIEEYFNK
jgi:putative NADPH-quinone reductase